MSFWGRCSAWGSAHHRIVDLWVLSAGESSSGIVWSSNGRQRCYGHAGIVAQPADVAQPSSRSGAVGTDFQCEDGWSVRPGGGIHLGDGAHGYIRSSGRLAWHVNELMPDTSPLGIFPRWVCGEDGDDQHGAVLGRGVLLFWVCQRGQQPVMHEDVARRKSGVLPSPFA